jgi:hypothetical protein
MTPIQDAERPRFLTDENFNLLVVAGLRRLRPQVDILTIQSTEMLHAPDSQVLAFAKERDRILLSHDTRTMPGHFADFLLSLPVGEHCPGLFLISQDTPIALSIQWILEVWEASRHEEWRNLPTRLPL